jgi:DNA adenine methylase
MKKYSFFDIFVKFCCSSIPCGGAMFFHLIQYRRFTAYLSDTNKELITTYKVVKDYVGNLIEVLDKHQEEYKKNPFQYFYRLRAAKLSNDIEKAARFIALNKTCFNGLYRVNKKGNLTYRLVIIKIHLFVIKPI